MQLWVWIYVLRNLKIPLEGSLWKLEPVRKGEKSLAIHTPRQWVGGGWIQFPLIWMDQLVLVCTSLALTAFFSYVYYQLAFPIVNFQNGLLVLSGFFFLVFWICCYTMDFLLARKRTVNTPHAILCGHPEFGLPFLHYVQVSGFFLSAGQKNKGKDWLELSLNGIILFPF